MQGLRCPLTLIVAPAGFGKTTLAASYVAAGGMPAAWLSLDKNDNQELRFLRYLIAAIQTTDGTIGSEASKLLAADQQTPPEAVMTSLINDLDAAGNDMALVLDDYQFINNQSVHLAVSFLLEHCPRTLHLVIATRSDPQFPLARLRARGQTMELRAADLRFDGPEAAQFLNDIMGLNLDAELIEILEKRSEGWIAGLQMAALSIRRHDDVESLIREFAGTNRFIMDFLLEEVLAREPEDIQDFLLKTSILARLSGPLCDAVTGASGGQSMLEKLERGNLFVVPLDIHRHWYRYHHLFADLLKAKLHRSGGDHAARLLSRAAEWCEAEGSFDEAVSYALAAKDFERAAGLVARHWFVMTNTGEIETLWSWISALPSNMVGSSARLSMVYCWVLWFRGRIDQIETHLLDVEGALGDPAALKKADIEGDHALLPAELATLHAFVARYKNDFKSACAFAERALSLVPGDLPPQMDIRMRTPIWLARATAYDGAGDLIGAAEAYLETIRLSRLDNNTAGVTGITYRLIGILLVLGRLPEADRACRDALEYIEAQGMSRLPAAGILHIAMSQVLVERNDLPAAEAHLLEGLELGKWSGRFDAVRNAAPAQARIKQARQKGKEALEAIHEAESAAGGHASHLARAELLALKAKMLARQGEMVEAARVAKEAVHLAGEDSGQTGEMAALAMSRVKLDRSRPDEAVAHLTRSLARAESRGRWGSAIELHIFRSLALMRQRKARDAEHDLETALTLAEPAGYVRIFLDEGPPMQALLAQWLSHASNGPLKDYAKGLLSQFDPWPTANRAYQGPASANGDLNEPLSQREVEVLNLLAVGWTNRKIGEQLFISAGTVKAHTASIYRKLDVANRTEAVAVARRLGIFS